MDKISNFVKLRDKNLALALKLGFPMKPGYGNRGLPQPQKRGIRWIALRVRRLAFVVVRFGLFPGSRQTRRLSDACRSARLTEQAA